MINQKYGLITIFGAVILRVSSVWPVNGCLWLTALVSFDISLVSLAESCLLDLSWASFRPLNSGKTFQRFQSLCTEKNKAWWGQRIFPAAQICKQREASLCWRQQQIHLNGASSFSITGGKSSLWLLLFWFQVLLWRHFCDVTWFVLNWICYCTYLHQKETVEEVQASVRKTSWIPSEVLLARPTGRRSWARTKTRWWDYIPSGLGMLQDLLGWPDGRGWREGRLTYAAASNTRNWMSWRKVDVVGFSTMMWLCWITLHCWRPLYIHTGG